MPELNCDLCGGPILPEHQYDEMGPNHLDPRICIENRDTEIEGLRSDLAASGSALAAEKAAYAQLTRVNTDLRTEHEKRVTQLLSANNAEVDKRRAAETQVRHLEDEMASGRAHRDTLREEVDRLTAGIQAIHDSKLRGTAFGDWVQSVCGDLLAGREVEPEDGEGDYDSEELRNPKVIDDAPADTLDRAKELAAAIQQMLGTGLASEAAPVARELAGVLAGQSVDTASTPGEKQEAATDEVLIFSGEHGAYWRASRGGYTTDPDDAGRYSRAEAESIVAGCGREKRLRIEPVPPTRRVRLPIPTSYRIGQAVVNALLADGPRERDITHQLFSMADADLLTALKSQEGR